MAYESDIRNGLYKQKKNQSKDGKNYEDWKFLRHLANTLSEIITEKEVALQNQIDINKDLLKRI